ncbi:hypothetical protein SAMN06295905_1397 [Devosia lucknowensis]|uniref:Uncharacterized protein n=1 Tax=Devosia lucknowensis TaxID=1096929 RepID=A0A1Y6EV71_9HYPH|nr:hypothetical protein [Devosia lucknowensis]SMQ66109.1 hypothetical protein SAMN06295905_1397 [Devosia lucknowensis]
MSVSTEPDEQAEHDRGHVAYNLAGIVALVLLLAVGLAYAIDQQGRASRLTLPALDDGNPVVQTIAGRDLSIPASWFRFGEAIKPGFASQVDLALRLDVGPGAQPVEVDATILPRSGARASAALLDAVYLHQFADETASGIPGLVGKPLMASEGYAGETVWYDPLSPAPFVAKCSAAPDRARKDRCLRTLHLPSGLAVVLSFDAEALPAWKQFDEELARWLGQIGAL